jgi:hypothetical protein
MSSETIWTRIREKPFKPFLLNTSDGKSYAISHPEMISLTKHRVHVYIFEPGQKPGEDLAEHEVVISPLHVASLADIGIRKSRR